MKTIAVIAEYNPFHNGHAYQLQEIREQFHADNIVIAMSGDFVQRGTPAWTDKYLRTRMALAGGADFVFELPVRYAVASAESFALGAVQLLNALGFVDGLCFGSENGDLDSLQEIANYLCHPSEDYHDRIQSLLKKGHSYPHARETLLRDAFPSIFSQDTAFLSKPNHILGIEYLKALQNTKSNIIPMTLARTDSGYHSHSPVGSFCSASGIRALYQDKDFDRISPFIPKSVQRILTTHPDRYPLTENHLSDLLFQKLSFCQRMKIPLTNFQDVSQDLQDKIYRLLPAYVCLDDFIKQLKSKQYTHSRLCRALLHILLDLPADVHDFSTSHTLPSKTLPYLRLLGFRPDKSSLLRTVHEAPVVTKVADGLTTISSFWNDYESHSLLTKAEDLFQEDLYAARLYQYLSNAHLGSQLCDEYRMGVQIYN